MENGPFEDVFPLKKRDIALLCDRLPEGISLHMDIQMCFFLRGCFGAASSLDGPICFRFARGLIVFPTCISFLPSDALYALLICYFFSTVPSYRKQDLSRFMLQI